MNLIESNTDLQLLNPKDVTLVVPVWSSPKGHELMFPISFVYIRTKDTDFILNFQYIRFVMKIPLFWVIDIFNQKDWIMSGFTLKSMVNHSYSMSSLLRFLRGIEAII